MFSRKYVNDYEIKVEGKKKVTVYRGEYYYIQADEKQIRKLKCQYSIVMATLLLIFALGGFINNGGSRAFYVIMPYVVLMIPLFYMTLASIQFALMRERLQRIDFDAIVTRLKKTGAVVIGLCSMTVIGEIVYLAIYFNTVNRGKEFLFLAAAFSIGILTFVFRKLQDQYQWEKVSDGNI